MTPSDFSVKTIGIWQRGTSHFSGPQVLFKTCVAMKFVDDDDDDDDDFDEVDCDHGNRLFGDS